MVVTGRRKSLLGLVVILPVVVLLFKRNFPIEDMIAVPVLSERKVGDVVDELHGVKIFYNGSVGNTNGRRRAPDGYNYGLGYQCVEFVKRYYYEKLGHRMPDTWGHAKDFYDSKIDNGDLNPARGLLQFRNGGGEKPVTGDLLVFGPTLTNQYGHVAIVSEVNGDTIEIAQQNPGPFGKSRVRMKLEKNRAGWRVSSDRVQGWLRRPLLR